MCLIVFQFQRRGGFVSKCWVPTNSWWRGRSPKETLTVICSSTTAFQVGRAPPPTHAGHRRWKEEGVHWCFGAGGSHYDLGFLSVRKDYAIDFLSELMWGDYTLEFPEGLKDCPAPLLGQRQSNVFFCCCCEPVACQQVWKWDWQEQRAAAAPLTQAGGQTRTCERQRHS